MMYEIDNGTYVNPKHVDWVKASPDGSLQISVGDRVLRFGPFNEAEVTAILQDLDNFSENKE